MKLTKERKEYIDSLDYETLLHILRFAPIGDMWFQGETGEYRRTRMTELRNRAGGSKKYPEVDKRID